MNETSTSSIIIKEFKRLPQVSDLLLQRPLGFGRSTGKKDNKRAEVQLGRVDVEIGFSERSGDSFFHLV